MNEHVAADALALGIALGIALGSLVSPTTFEVGEADDVAFGDSLSVAVAVAVEVAPGDIVAAAAGVLAASTAEESRANSATVPIKAIRIRPGLMWLDVLRIGTLAFLLLLGLRIGARVGGLERRHARPVTETNPTR